MEQPPDASWFDKTFVLQDSSKPLAAQR